MQPTVQDIELSIKDAEEMVALGTALERLQKNRDFKKLFLEGYIEKEAIRLVSLKGSPHTQKPEVQESIVKEMDGIGAFLGYMSKIFWEADRAKDSIQEANQMILEMDGDE